MSTNHYGGLISSSGTLAGANTMRFSSKPAILSATGAWGFYYYGYRFYDPGMQRWLNRDPLGESDGSNLYAFVRSNPMTAIDPDGRASFKDFAKACWKKAAGPGVLCVSENCRGKDLSAFTYLAEKEGDDAAGKEQEKRLRSVPQPDFCVAADAVYAPGGAYKIKDGGAALIDCESGSPRIQDAGSAVIHLVPWKADGSEAPPEWPHKGILPYKTAPPKPPEPPLNPFSRPSVFDIH